MMSPEKLLRVRYALDDGVPLVAKRRCLSSGLGTISGAKLKQVVAFDHPQADFTSVDFTIDSPSSGARKPLSDADEYSLHYPVFSLHVRGASREPPLAPRPRLVAAAVPLPPPPPTWESVGGRRTVARSDEDADEPPARFAADEAAMVAAAGSSVRGRTGCKACRQRTCRGTVRCLAWWAQVEGANQVARDEVQAVEDEPEAEAEAADEEEDDDDDEEQDDEEQPAPTAMPTVEDEAEAEEADDDAAATTPQKQEEPEVEDPVESTPAGVTDAPGEGGTAPNTPDEPTPWPTDVVEPGALVWAKMHGFPWWPAQVRRVTEDGDEVRVRFCGTRQLGVVARTHAAPFGERPELCEERTHGKQLKRSMRAKFRASIAEARAAAAGELSFSASEDEEEDDDDDEEDDDDESMDAEGGNDGDGAEDDEANESEGEEDDEDEEEDDEALIASYVPVGPPIGTVVWGKMYGFPWWPATVQPPSRAMLGARPREGGAAFVRFFGQGASYAWVEADEEHLVTFVADDEPLCAATQVKKALRSKWRRAIQEAKEASEASKGLEL